MLKILLPLLMLFSMSSFASLITDPSYAAPDYLEADSVVISAGNTQRPCVAENEPFERLYIVTGAATQYLEPQLSTIKSEFLLLPKSLPNEVGWRNLNS